MWQNLTALKYLYTVFLIGTVWLFGQQLYAGNWLQTDLNALLPQEQQWSQIQINADKLQEKQFNQKIIALVGHQNNETAFKIAEIIQKEWERSHVFGKINIKNQLNLEQLKHTVKQLSYAVLPKKVKDQLSTTPQVYFQQYAEQITSPFVQTNLLSLKEDWLGFGRFTLTQSQTQNNIQWYANNGMLYIIKNGKTWVLLQGELAQNNLINPENKFLDVIKLSQEISQKNHAQWLITGAPLFASMAKKQAEQESTLMSFLGIGLVLLLLLMSFRTFRILWLFIPIAIGMLCGVSLTILFFGQIHILTLVIGTSLIGVLIDFPLHWFASSLFTPKWDAQTAMKKLSFTFMISLFITLLGYGLLGFSSLPVLKQTAFFSSIALISATLCTLLYLPFCFKHYQPKVRSNFLKNFTLHFPKKIEYVIAIFLCSFILIGLYKSEWKDDIRQWISIPPDLLKQAEIIGEITGINLTNQYFLVTAENDDSLLEKESELTTHLSELQKNGDLSEFQSISQWISSPKEQREFALKIKQKIKPQDYAILTSLGVPSTAIEQSLQVLSEQPPVSLKQALNTQLGQAWKSLYLGEIMPDKVAGLVKISGIKNLEKITQLSNGKDIYWQDKRSHLNETFQQTRDQAAWLKLMSFILAGFLLLRFFTARNTLKMLIVPLIAIIATIGIFGWFAIPISLFTMFGLLLVSAISIDYTAYMQTSEEPINNKRIAILLASTTTVISFVLLSLSSTPAVASFGISVSTGVVLSILATFKILR